ncbi:MAG TPA: hypothetical protein VL069_00395 [Opitutus sp.]|nr:hypothetical protein [Opitutus sp.]
MTALVAGIHVFILTSASKTWMAGTKRAFTPVFDELCPAMTEKEQRLAFSRAQTPRGLRIHPLEHEGTWSAARRIQWRRVRDAAEATLAKRGGRLAISVHASRRSTLAGVRVTPDPPRRL